MKKLICALVLLAMLVPVAAMAGDAPLQYISLEKIAKGEYDGVISFSTSEYGIEYKTDEYKAKYYMTGALRNYSVLYTSDSDQNGVTTTFMPDGSVFEIRRENDRGPKAQWNFADGYWFSPTDRDAESLPMYEQYTPAAVGADKSPYDVKYKTPTQIPPRYADELLEDYGFDGEFEDLCGLMQKHLATVTDQQISTFKKEWDQGGNGPEDFNAGTLSINLGQNYGTGVAVLINGRPAIPDDNGVYTRAYVEKYDKKQEGQDIRGVSLESVAFIKGNVITVVAVDGGSIKKTVTVVGGLHYNDDNTKILLDGGMSGNDLMLNAEYDSDGERAVYFVYGENYNTKTAYDNENRLVSHEYFDSVNCYWGFEDGAWVRSMSGGRENFVPVDNSTEVSDEALRSLALTTAVAKYQVSTATTAGAAEAGLPIVIDDGSALNGAQLAIECTINNEETTTFEIEPIMNGKAVTLNKPVQMYLPLPNGFDAKIAKKYGMTIDHEGEIFSTADGSATITDDGILITASSYSPYRVMWGAASKETFAKKVGDVDLPSTGDSSNLLAYACLLMVSAAALYMLGKRRAHQ